VTRSTRIDATEIGSFARHLLQPSLTFISDNSKSTILDDHIDSIYYTKLICIHDDCNRQVWTSYDSSLHADCLADGRHERHMMRQRGAGYAESPSSVTSSNRSHACLVLGLFLQTLASFSRLVLSKLPTPPPPSHQYP